MSNKLGDQPAFPLLYAGDTATPFCNDVMSVRQYFAASALQGLIAKYNLKTPEDQQIIAQMACELADSLITELNRSI